MQVAYIYDAPPGYASQFTGKERDTETGLDYFGARYYGSNMGRWMSPDWADKPTAVPYADFNDPQTLNQYGYLRNNPLSKTDPDGHGDDLMTPEEKAAFVQQTLNNPKELPLFGDRTGQGVKGGGQILLGIATIASIATGEPGPLVIATGILSGTTLTVRGTTNIMGAATNENVSKADQALAAMSNPAGLAVTTVTGGNFTAGRAAALAQGTGMAVTAAAQNPQSLGSAASVAKNTNLVVGISQLGSQVQKQNTTNVTPPKPKTPTPPPCAYDKKGC